MELSGAKQRQKKSVNAPQSGEKRRSSSEEEEKKKQPESSRFSPDAKLCVSLLCLSASLFITWLHVQQSARLAEITQKYQHLSEKSRGVLELEERVEELSRKLQSSSDLKQAVSWSLSSSAALQASSVLLRSLEERVRSVTGARGVSEELQELRSRSRAAHTHVTEQVNAAEAQLRELSERLQEVRDGTGRNTRALERSEEEDAGRLRELLDWSESRAERIHTHLQRLEEQGLTLRRRLDSRAPLHTHLPDTDEAVRSMLRVRAQLSATYRTLEQLQAQVQSAEERLRSSPENNSSSDL